MLPKIVMNIPMLLERVMKFSVLQKMPIKGDTKYINRKMESKEKNKKSFCVTLKIKSSVDV